MVLRDELGLFGENSSALCSNRCQENLPNAIIPNAKIPNANIHNAIIPNVL